MRLSKGTFYQCSSLTSVTIGNGVMSIGSSAFSWCTGLESITIPDSVTSIGDQAFYACNKLQYNEYGNALYLGNDKNPYVVLIEEKYRSTTSVDIHDATKVIYGGAFRNCSKLTSITISDSVMSIGSGAFEGCDNLQYNEYDNALYLGNEKNPYVVLIKAKEMSITSVDIHDATKLIYEDAFYQCSSLTSVTIPDSVTSIGVSAFQDCYRLETVTFEGTVAEWSAITKGYAWNHYSPFTEAVCSNGTVSV